jgi:hypothetical protein
LFLILPVSVILVGEVELQQVTETSGDGEQIVAKEMDRQIEAFMQRYAWAFASSIAFSKLSAYFAWNSTTTRTFF